MHLWGDEDFNWKKLDESINMVDSFMRLWGRIGVQSKEKYGTARIYVSFWDGSMHGLIYPGYYYYRFPKWFQKIDIYVFSKITRYLKLTKLVHWYQSKIYSIAYSRAIKRFPEVRIELVINADYNELIKEYETIMIFHRFRRLIEYLFNKIEEVE